MLGRSAATCVELHGGVAAFSAVCLTPALKKKDLPPPNTRPAITRGIFFFSVVALVEKGGGGEIGVRMSCIDTGCSDGSRVAKGGGRRGGEGL